MEDEALPASWPLLLALSEAHVHQLGTVEVAVTWNVNSLDQATARQLL